jgi:hypothetical protein
MNDMLPFPVEKSHAFMIAVRTASGVRCLLKRVVFERGSLSLPPAACKTCSCQPHWQNNITLSCTSPPQVLSQSPTGSNDALLRAAACVATVVACTTQRPDLSEIEGPGRPILWIFRFSGFFSEHRAGS